jgi:hypothetical protein
MHTRELNMPKSYSHMCDWCGQTMIAFAGPPRLSTVTYDVAGAPVSASVCVECIMDIVRLATQRGWSSPAKPFPYTPKDPPPGRKLLEVWQFGDQYQIRSLVGTDQEAVEALSKLVPDQD